MSRVHLQAELKSRPSIARRPIQVTLVSTVAVVTDIAVYPSDCFKALRYLIFPNEHPKTNVALSISYRSWAHIWIRYNESRLYVNTAHHSTKYGANG